MSHVNYSLNNQVATITLDDGKVNSFSKDMIDQVNDALDKAEADKAVVVLTGKLGVFSAGFHLPTMQSGQQARRDLTAAGFNLVFRLIKFPYPVIMACSGHALALGAVLLASGDYRLAIKGDFKIGLNEVNIGLGLTPMIVESFKYRLAPTHRQRCIILGELQSPESAVSCGFVDEVVDADKLLECAQQKGEQLVKDLDFPAFTTSKLSLNKDVIEKMEGNIDSDVANL